MEMPCYNLDTAPDGRTLVVVVRDAMQVLAVDIPTSKILARVTVPRLLQQAMVRPDGRVVYVSCDAEQKVVAIDTATWKVVKTFDTGYYPDGLAWAAIPGG